MEKARTWSWCAAVCLVARALIAQAQDLYVEQCVQITVSDGQPTQEMPFKIWVTPDKMRVDQSLAGGITIIMRSDLGKIWVIHANRYMERPLAELQKSAEAASKMLGDANMQIDLKTTGNTRKIGEWNCQEYLLSVTGGMPIALQIWVTPEVKIDSSLYAKMNEAMGANPMMSPILQRMREIPGYPIETVTKVAMGGQVMESTTTVKKISQKKIDPSVFELPTGLTKIEAPRPGAGPTPPARDTSPAPNKNNP